ncbi:hypothetical protein GGS23DRAFT_572296 [Durotheca rogersii]|uniref:uncharacterized protein n=1 Tax=Durotheca rogersii TaxID=419775 RepID=UPI002220D40A|nr:uncharacterized protein GGS23DRAFT_572296 [Durotheca rogersii]KAI5862416.1 hypothetical protein GGS23DRAFT_572296 [Durotheca rogersii]
MRASFAVSAAVLAFVQVAAATPPACLLSALGVQGDPTDFEALCGTLQPAIRGNLTESCQTGVLSQAYDAYSSKCLEQGVTVSKFPTSTSSAASSSATSSRSSTVTGPASSSATPTQDAEVAGSSSTPTGSDDSATPTGAGQATEPQPFLYAAAALLATGLTSVLFL